MKHYKSLLFLTVLLLIYCYFSLPLLLKIPPIWTDEAFYTDTVINIQNNNRVGTDLLKTIPNYNFDKLTLYYPPIFLYSLAFWLKILPFSIFNQRLFSLLISIGVLILVYLCSVKLLKKSKKTWLCFLPVIGLAVDDMFLYSSHISRPEIILLLIALLSFYIVINSDKNIIKTSLIELVSIGLLSAAAFLTHFIGVIYIISYIVYIFLYSKIEALKKLKFYIFIFFLVIPLVIWFTVTVLPQIDTFKMQLMLTNSRKNFDHWRWIWLFKFQPLSVILINLLYFLLSIILLLFSFFKIKRNRNFLLINIFISMSWIFAIVGKNIPYFVLPLPFIYLSVIILLEEAIQFNYFKKLSLIIVCLIFLLNINIFLNKLQKNSGSNYSYNKFINKILEIIPDNKAVFLSVIPDPYYGFYQNKRNNQLQEYPPFQTAKINYINTLNQSDYIIINGLYEAPVFGTLLLDYISVNNELITKIIDINQYNAAIIKLKPVKERLVQF